MVGYIFILLVKLDIELHNNNKLLLDIGKIENISSDAITQFIIFMASKDISSEKNYGQYCRRDPLLSYQLKNLSSLVLRLM